MTIFLCSFLWYGFALSLIFWYRILTPSIASVSGHWNAESVSKQIIKLNYYLPFFFAFAKNISHN